MTKLIDTVSIRIKRGTDGPDPTGSVSIICPPRSTSVGVNFDVTGTYSAETTVACWLQDAATGKPVSTGTVTLSPPGTWVAQFTTVPETRLGDTDTLIAQGGSTGSQYKLPKMTVTRTGENPCPTVTFPTSGHRSDPSGGVQIEGFTFNGQIPLDSAGNPMDLYIVGMVPAEFTVGGPLPSPSHVPEITLTPLASTAPAGSAANAFPIEIEGSRWSRSFSNVSEGIYALDNYRIIIKAELPADMAPLE